MTTQTTNTVISHTSDAEFRTWVAELIAMLTSAGLVQTSDTGQINTATATRPGTNTEGGYAIFRFNDTQQATAPIFMRFGFGTGSAATAPRVQLIVGTASNGSGTISGVGISITSIGASAAPASAVTAYTTRVCVVDGFFGLMWKLGATNGTNAALGFCAICRSTDSSGAATAEAAAIYTGNNAPAVTMARYQVPSTTAMTAGSYSLIIGGYTTSLVSGAAQVFKHYLAMPKVVPNQYLLTVLSAEIGNNTSFTATPIGVTSHTYISGGSQGVITAGLPAAAGNVVAMIWE